MHFHHAGIDISIPFIRKTTNRLNRRERLETKLRQKDKDNLDLLLYFAAALVALIFAERLLQAQDS